MTGQAAEANPERLCIDCKWMREHTLLAGAENALCTHPAATIKSFVTGTSSPGYCDAQRNHGGDCDSIGKNWEAK